MHKGIVSLLGAMSQDEQEVLVEILRDRCHVPQDETRTLKELFIQAYGEDEEEVYCCLIEEVAYIKKVFADG